MWTMHLFATHPSCSHADWRALLPSIMIWILSWTSSLYPIRKVKFCNNRGGIQMNLLVIIEYNKLEQFVNTSDSVFTINSSWFPDTGFKNLPHLAFLSFHITSILRGTVLIFHWCGVNYCHQTSPDWQKCLLKFIKNYLSYYSSFTSLFWQ